VKNTYYLWKEEYLGKCLVPEKDVVTSVLEKVIEKAIRDRVQIKRHLKALRKLTTKCLEHLSATSLRDNLLLCIKSNLRTIMRCVTADLQFPKKICHYIGEVDKAICDYLKDLNYSNIVDPEDFDLPLKVTASNLYSQMAEYLRNRYSPALDEIDMVRPYFNSHHLLTPTTQKISASNRSKNTAKVLSTYPIFSQCQREYFLDISNLTNQMNLNEFNATFNRNFLERRMKELINREKNRGELSIIQDKTIKNNADFTRSEFHEYEKHMDAFKPGTTETFRKLIDEVILTETRSMEQDLKAVLKKAIQQDFEQHVWRSSLPTMHLHKIGSAVEYIASLRLTQCSLCRTFRNQSLEESVLGGSKEEHHDIGWQFEHIGRSYVVIERTRITANACSSLVQIETGANNYLKLSYKIQNLLNSCGKYSNGNIVLWIRQILTGDKALEFDDSILPKARHDLTLFLVQLAHLFVGTESIRFPAALVQSQMIMDLIEGNHLTWSQAFTESEDHIYYPMILEKATNVCRTLDTVFHAYSFYSHKYPGNSLNIEDEKVSQYINAESKLTNKWFATQKPSEESHEQIMLQTILKAILRWYPNVRTDS
jgi:hypothetical protein